MRHLKGAVWTERLLLILILASLAGTLNLVMTVHRRVRALAAGQTSPQPEPPAVSSPAPPIVAAQPSPEPARPPAGPAATPPPAPVATPAEDPTAAILARMDRAVAREIQAARDADRRAESHEAAIRRSVAESQRWKRREMLVRQQVAALSRKADKAELDVAALDAERDVLERERDILKAATAKASQKSGYALLPYKGPNGTWRRPIVLECSGDTVKLQPNGPTFTAMDLSPLVSPSSSPLVLAIAREMLHIQQAQTPDGAPAVPYLVFMVRPDGIRPYYRSRERLEPLGISFGYELVEQDLAVSIPNLDDVTTWDGTVPLDTPELAALEATRRSRAASSESPDRDGRQDASPGWPSSDRVAANEPSAPAASRRPPSGEGDGPPALSPATGSNAAGGGQSGAPPSEIDPGGALARGQRAAMGPPGGAGDGSPADFVWPGQSAAGSAAGRSSARGDGRGWSGGDSEGGGTASRRAAITPYGSTRPSASPATPTRSAVGAGANGTRAGGSSYVSSAAPGAGGSGFPEAGEPGRGSGTGAGTGLGLDTTGVASGQPTRGQAGPVDLSPGRFGTGIRGGGGSPDNGPSRGGGSAAGGGIGNGGGGGPGAGPGLAGGDPLPNLEPAQDSTTSSGTPATAKPSSSPTSGGARPSTGSGTATPGGGTSEAATAGSNPPAPDPGFAPYAGAPSEEAKGGTGPGSPPPGEAGPMRGGSPPAAFGSAQPLAAAEGGAGSQTTADPSATPRGGSGGYGAGSPPPAGPSGSSASQGPRGTAGATWGTPINGPTPSTIPPGNWSAAPGNSPPPPPGGVTPPASLASALGSAASSQPALTNALGGLASGSPSASSTSSASTSSSSSSTPSGSWGSSSSPPPPGTASAGQGLSLPSPNASPDPDSEPDSLKPLASPPIDTHRLPGRIEVPFEIVVVCRKDDVLLHPGGYRITNEALRARVAGDNRNEDLLARELVAIVRRRAQVDPLIRPKPRIKFLVETGGGTTFWTAQQQLIFSNLDWPMTMQVAGPQTALKLDDQEDARR